MHNFSIRSHTYASIIICLVILAGFITGRACQAQSMFRGNPSHSGSFTGTAPRQLHGIKWKFATGDRIVSSPVIDNNRIYFGSDDGNIYAVDAETGRQIWKRGTKGPVSSTPAIAGQMVYAPSYDGRLY